MNVDRLRIVSLDTIDGCRDHIRLQGSIWGEVYGEVVPVHLLIAIARSGGVVLGAYAGDEIVGLLLSTLALIDGRAGHLSHMLGVRLDWRGRGVGERLKWRQRELVIAQGFDTIVWTYDPLESANARLNLTHLGGIVHTYTRDYYGAMGDALNRGVPSDRFTVEWHLNSERVRNRAAIGAPPIMQAAPIALAAGPAADGLAQPGEFMPPAAGPVLVEIPPSIQEIKRHGLDCALAWRLATRAAFEQLFSAGFRAVDVVRRDASFYYYFEPDDDQD